MITPLQNDALGYCFVESAAVAVGAFNTHIVHPEWLKDVGLIDREENPLVEIDFQRPGIRLRMQRQKTTWIIRPDRLAVETTDRNKDPGSQIAKVLELLPWTPLVAVGLNYRYEADSLPASP